MLYRFNRQTNGCWYMSEDIGIEILDADINWIYANVFGYVIIEKEHTEKSEPLNIFDLIKKDSDKGWIGGFNRFYIKIEDKKTLAKYTLRYNLTKVEKITYDKAYYRGDYDLIYAKYMNDKVDNKSSTMVDRSRP